MELTRQAQTGPAYNSQELSKGDVILMVNGKEVDDESLHGQLIGSDVPGSFVKITVRPMGSQHPKDVTLMRSATSAIADNVRMFELFSALKDQALLTNDRFTESRRVSLIEEGIELWTVMLQSQAEASEKLQKNVGLMQGRSQQLTAQLTMLLNELQG
jgi:hypothetical protein